MKNLIGVLSVLFFVPAYSQEFEISMIEGFLCEPSDSIVSGETLMYEYNPSVDDYTLEIPFVIRSLSNDTLQVRLDREWILENDTYTPHYLWGPCGDATGYSDDPMWEFNSEVVTIDSANYAHFKFIGYNLDELEVPFHARYYVVNELSEGEEEKVDSVDIVISPLVSLNESENEVNISLNSITKSITLKATNTDISQASISIFDSNGKMVFTLEKQLNSEENIDLSDVQSGLYFIQINNQDGQTVLREKFLLPL